MGDPSSLDHAGSESEFDSGRELDSEREPDSGRELDSDRESYTGTSGPSESPFETSTPYQKARAGSSRTPFRTLQQSGPSRLPMSGRKGKSVSQLPSISGGEYDSNPRKKKRLIMNCTEQENLGSEQEQNSDNEHVTTNALLMSLIKRLDRQEKRLSQMQQKMDQAVMPTSSSSGRTPSRASRRKEVPLEVRVSYVDVHFSIAYLGIPQEIFGSLASLRLILERF